MTSIADLPVRIAPSGPVSGDGKLSPPLLQVAGQTYEVTAPSTGNGFIPNVIGPANASPEDSSPLTLSTPLAIPGFPSVAPNKYAMVSVGTDLGGYGAGEWLVEASVAVAFGTQPPADAVNCGGFNVSLLYATDDGTTNAGGISLSTNSPLPRDMIPTVTSGGQTVHSSRYVGVLHITPEMIALNNGLPFKNICLQLGRQTNAGDGQTYGNASGSLRISRETNVTLRRIR